MARTVRTRRAARRSAGGVTRDLPCGARRPRYPLASSCCHRIAGRRASLHSVSRTSRVAVRRQGQSLGGRCSLPRRWFPSRADGRRRRGPWRAGAGGAERAGQSDSVAGCAPALRPGRRGHRRGGPVPPDGQPVELRLPRPDGRPRPGRRTPSATSGSAPGSTSTTAPLAATGAMRRSRSGTWTWGAASSSRRRSGRAATRSGRRCGAGSCGSGRPRGRWSGPACCPGRTASASGRRSPTRCGGINRAATGRAPLANSDWEFSVSGVTLEAAAGDAWQYALGALLLDRDARAGGGQDGSWLLTVDLDREIGSSLWGGERLLPARRRRLFLRWVRRPGGGERRGGRAQP